MEIWWGGVLAGMMESRNRTAITTSRSIKRDSTCLGRPYPEINGKLFCLHRARTGFLLYSTYPPHQHSVTLSLCASPSAADETNAEC